MFVEFFMVFVVLKDGKFFLSRIDGFLFGWIRKVFLFSIFFKFCSGRCNFLRYVFSFVCLVGLNIVRM